jgi:apolipoprotein N-acyltransferase
MLDFFARFKKIPGIYVLPFLGGLCLTLSFAPFNISVLAWFSFIPLFYSLRDGKFAFLKGFIMGFAFFSTLLYWLAFADVVEGTIVPLVVLGAFILVVYLASFFGFAGIFYNKLNKMGYVYLFPIVFAGLEFLRSLSSVWGFTWGSVGFSQSNLIHLIQFASIGSLPLVTLWVLFLNIFLYLFFKGLNEKKRDKTIYLFSFLSLLIIPFIYSQVILHRGISSGEYKTIGVIQPNVLPEDKRKSGFDRLVKIKKIVENCPQADLYVLSETASPFPISYNYEVENFFRDLAGKKNAPIITGTIDYKKQEGKVSYFNTASILDSSGIRGVYRKVFLVPFVERLPFDDVLPNLKKIDLGQGGFTPGTEFAVFDIDGIVFSVYICYEAIFPQLIRKFVNSGAEFLVNITEDGWFGRTNGPYQHAQMAAFQSIIFRRSVVRSANTGISLISDPYGRIVRKTQIFREDFIVYEVPLLECKTVYARIGDIFGWFFLFFILLIIISEPVISGLKKR